VYAKVTGFTPYFYISLPDSWEEYSKKEIKNKLNIMCNWLKSRDNKKIWYKCKNSLLEINYVKKNRRFHK